jgi:hypothetical protein
MFARLRYVGEVLRHAAPFAGWVAGLVTLLYGGSIIGGAAWLANTHHRTLAVALLAGRRPARVRRGSYRVWGSLTASLAAAHASMSELDAPEAKRAYIDEQVERGRSAKTSRISSETSTSGRTRCERISRKPSRSTWRGCSAATPSKRRLPTGMEAWA